MSQPAPSAEPRPPSEPVADIPVTVIGGYLGSGKTTLVNHLLTVGTERVAVLVNDFGDVDIDADLIERDDGDTIALANGCICCSLVDGLAAALDTVSGFEPRPQRLVIEASGVADPASVAAYGHGPGFELDAVVVLVDAETVRRRAGDKYVGDTVMAQLRAADIVVVNKTDLVSAEDVAALGRWLRDRVDRALLVEASRARVDPAVLFGVVDQRHRSTEPEAAVVHAEDLFQTWSWVDERPVARRRVERLMDELPESVVRAKGILFLDTDGADEANGVEDSDESGPARPHVLQRVGGRWSLRPLPSSAPGAGTAGSRLVVIGRRGAIDDGWLTARMSG